MKCVYIVRSGIEGKILGVFLDENKATDIVLTVARTVYDFNPAHEIPDFEGALMRYGWAEIVWWEKEFILG